MKKLSEIVEEEIKRSPFLMESLRVPQKALLKIFCSLLCRGLSRVCGCLMFITIMARLSSSYYACSTGSLKSFLCTSRTGHRPRIRSITASCVWFKCLVDIIQVFYYCIDYFLIKFIWFYVSCQLNLIIYLRFVSQVLKIKSSI